jgi:arylsulfatase A-like enzyme
MISSVKTLSLIASIILPLHALCAAEATKPNVIVIMVDDLGTGDVSSLFGKSFSTPNIDRLAATGVKFSSGYVTAPLCGPSRAGLFTGVYQQKFNFITNSGGIPTDRKLYPAALKEAGYRTGLIGKWHSAGPMPHERGCFDETLCSPKSTPFIDFYKPVLARNGKVETFNEYSTDLFAKEAESFIERHKDQPFALTVTFNAPHILKVVQKASDIEKDYDAALAQGKILDVPKAPMARPGEAEKYAAQFPGDSARADTVATIVALDQAIGRILDKLKETGIDQKTIVFFTGDNGGHPENRSENLPLRNYKWTLYEGGIRVPFFGVYPGVFPAGLDYKEPVSTLDIYATCAALTGASAPADLDGVNLTPYLKGEKSGRPHEVLYFGIKNGFYLGAIREGAMKLILPHGQKPQLYDLSNDISEKNDLAESQPEQVATLTKKWETWDELVGSPRGAPDAPAKKGGPKAKRKPTE